MGKQGRRVFVRCSRHWYVAVTATMLSLLFSSAAIAQETVIIGGSGQSAVDVNLGALRDLDGRQRVRTLRFPGEASDDAIVLKPPAGSRTALPAGQRPILTAPAPSLRPSVPAAPTIARPIAPTPMAAPPVREAAEAAPIVVAPPAPPVVARQAPAPDAAAPERIAPRDTVRPAPAPETAPQRTAALPPAAPNGDGPALRLLLDGSATQLGAGAQAQLQQFAATLGANERRIQLKAFATGASDRPSAARRESLSRALAVRSYLIENGVRSTRIDVRALGEPTDGGPNDRVDVILLTQ